MENFKYFFRQYKGGGTREFEIFSKLKFKDDWDFCLNGSLSEIQSRSDEVTHYYPLQQQKSVRFVEIRIQSVYQATDGTLLGGLQFFSENNLGTIGASYQGKSGSLQVENNSSLSLSSGSRHFSKVQLLLGEPDVYRPRIWDFHQQA